MKNQNLLITLTALLIFTAAGFFSGIKYQQSKARSFTTLGQFGSGRNGANQPAGRGGRFMTGGQVFGDIIAADDKSITVKLMDGTSKIIIISSSTTINKAAAATISDLKVGQKVGAFGSTNTDGSVTASSIQLNPVMRGPSPSPTK